MDQLCLIDLLGTISSQIIDHLACQAKQQQYHPQTKYQCTEIDLLSQEFQFLVSTWASVSICFRLLLCQSAFFLRRLGLGLTVLLILSYLVSSISVINYPFLARGKFLLHVLLLFHVSVELSLERLLVLEDRIDRLWLITCPNRRDLLGLALLLELLYLASRYFGSLLL